jgi:hypothetical protein
MGEIKVPEGFIPQWVSKDAYEISPLSPTFILHDDFILSRFQSSMNERRVPH